MIVVLAIAGGLGWAIRTQHRDVRRARVVRRRTRIRERRGAPAAPTLQNDPWPSQRTDGPEALPEPPAPVTCQPAEVASPEDLTAWSPARPAAAH